LTAHEPPAPQLPDGHLALVVDDVVAEVDAWLGATPATGPDLRRALLYGWATGATTARELALRSRTDDGLRHLLQGATPPFGAIRAYREVHASELEQFYAAIFEILAVAGLSHLGQIRLPAASSTDAPVDTYNRLARELLSSAASADLRADRELGESIQGDELPAQLAAREPRRQVFRTTRRTRRDAIVAPPPLEGRDLGANRDRFATDAEATQEHPLLSNAGPAVAPGRSPVGARGTTHRFTLRDAVAIIATFIVVFGGMLLVRWVAVASAPAAAETRASTAPSSDSISSALVGLTPETAIGGTPVIGAQDQSLAGARDEAVRLATEALDDNDLQAARDLYFLASQAVPDDEEAADRLRQLDTALHVNDRRADWDDAILDLTDLRVAAPDSSAVLQAYVSGLVGAGRAALTARDPSRAAALCGEAVRWFPQRDDARSCLILSGGAPTATPVDTATPPPTLSPTATPVPAATASLSAATPIGLAPNPTPAADALQVNLSGTCQAAADGGMTLRLSGNVTAGGAPVPSYQLMASAIPPSGGVISIANTTYLTSIFAIQQRVEATGSYLVNVSIDKEGFSSAQTSVRVSC
jgi:hypothetical protein